MAELPTDTTTPHQSAERPTIALDSLIVLTVATLRAYKKQISTLLAAIACSTLLSSCYMFWNTGERLEESAVTYTGMDMSRPVGGVAYKYGGKFYVQVPEVTYKNKHSLSGFTTILGGRFTEERSETRITDYAPTGRTFWYEADGDIWEEDGKFYYNGTQKPTARPVAGCPAGAKRIPFGQERHGDNIYDSDIIQTDTTRRKGAWLYNAGAIPIKYVVDPVLMVVTTPVANAVGISAGAAGFLWYVIIAPFTLSQQQESDTPAEPQTEQ